MFLRFVTARRDEATGAESGFFRPAYCIKYGDLDAEDWVRQAIVRELEWFNSHLPVPRRLSRRGGRHGFVRGVCWFRPAASEAISRARHVAWLLTEAGYPVMGLRRRDPGEIIWRDYHQVVAKPPRDLERVFA